MKKLIRIQRSENGYGTSIWLGPRIRVGTPKTMTPKWPHVYMGGDECCNSVLAFHLYPLVSIDIWWQWRQRPPELGMCGRCILELTDMGFTAQEVYDLNTAHIASALEAAEELRNL